MKVEHSSVKPKSQTWRY